MENQEVNAVAVAEKHLRLSKSIGRIDIITRRLEDLACRIKSNESPPPDPSETKKRSKAITDRCFGGRGR